MRICALSEAVFASWSFRHIQMLVIRVRLWSCQPKRIQQLETLDAVTGRFERTRLNGPPPLPMDLHLFFVPECVFSLGNSVVGVEEKKREEVQDGEMNDDLGVNSRAAESNVDSIALHCLER